MISGGDVGGAKTHVLSLLDGLNKTEDVHLICFTEGEFAQEARRLGIPTSVLCDGSLFSVRSRILAMLRHDGYQVIHCHGARANMMGMLLRRRAAIPVISTIHSGCSLPFYLTHGFNHRGHSYSFTSDNAQSGIDLIASTLITENTQACSSGFKSCRGFIFHN